MHRTLHAALLAAAATAERERGSDAYLAASLPFVRAAATADGRTLYRSRVETTKDEAFRH